MKLDAPKNNNYAATVVRVNTIVELSGLDNLVGVPVLGHQALTTRGIEAGELRIAFTSETQLSEEYCRYNNLYRDATLNLDPTETGYLEGNRRVRALKLRGHTSNALLMPLSSLAYTGVNPADFKEGDTFDKVMCGQEICNKYEIPVKPGSQRQVSKVEKAFNRVTTKQFPEHLDTDQYHRSKHLLDPAREVVISQKLHGTSVRVGRVPVLRELTRRERIAKWFGVSVPEWEFDLVSGSRKVIKDGGPGKSHFYDTDLWSAFGKTIGDLIPEGVIVYGELIGWVPGTDTPLQKNYTYNVEPGSCELYVYRVATINRHGHLSDLSWDGVKEFCVARGLKFVPELTRGAPGDLDDWLAAHQDARIAEVDLGLFTHPAVPLSHKLTVDEGFCIRQEGLTPTILKAKSPVFLEHETKLLDKGEADLESCEAVA